MNIISKLAVALLLFVSAVKAQQPPPAGPPPSPQERLKRTTEHLEKELALKPEQKKKIQAAYKEFFSGMEKLRGDMPPPPPPPPGEKEDVDKLVAARNKKVKSILTVAQFKKYEQIEKEMRMRRPGGRPQPPPQRH